MKINKYSALGNKIILVDNSLANKQKENIEIHNFLKKKKADYDQWILIESSTNNENNFKVSIFNQDGSSAENCLNGALCLANYLNRNFNNKESKIKTISSQWVIKSLDRNQFSVKMKLPKNKIIAHQTLEIGDKGQYKLILPNDECIEVSLINISNPHAVIFSNSLESDPLRRWGNQIQKLEYFPNGINLSIVCIENRKSIELRVYERGVGETLACGSGACAAVMSGIKLGFLNDNIKARFKNGNLNIGYDKTHNTIEVIGPSNHLEEIYLD